MDGQLIPPGARLSQPPVERMRTVSSSSQQEGTSMINYISGLVFVALLILGGVMIYPFSQSNPEMAAGAGLGWAGLSLIIASGLRLTAQWERGVVFRLGKFHKIKGPGLFLVIPIFDTVEIVDTRVRAMDIPAQQVITKDNVPVQINGVLFFKVSNAADVIIKVQDYRFAINQYAQTSLRDAIGQLTLDELLMEREQIGRAIEKNVEKDTEGWGLEVTGIRIQDIDMPEELKKMMSRQASAEREKRATITKAQGDKEAAFNLAAAAETMAASPGAMQLRTLQTIDGLGPTASNTVVLAVPINILDAVNEITRASKARPDGGGNA